MIVSHISYLYVWLKLFDPWTYIDVSYWALNSFPFVDNFLGTLNLGEKWWLG